MIAKGEPECENVSIAERKGEGGKEGGLWCVCQLTPGGVSYRTDKR